MSLVPLRPILDATDKYSYAQGAFNVNAVCQAEAVIRIHELFRSPAILQGADLANGFMGGRTDFMNATIEDKKIGARNIAAAVKKFAENSPIPIALHLDHGRDFDSVKAAIDGGYTSVMIDGSSLPLKDNIELTREVVKYAHARGVTVEGELGVLAGVEDHVFSEGSTYTNPMDAIRFFKETGTDALAISYGTMHGANKGKNAVVRKEIAIAVKECMRHEHIGPIWELMEKNRAAFDPRVFLPPVMDTVMYGNVPSESVQILTDLIRKGVMEVVGTLIVQFGSVGKAGLVEVKSLDEMAEFYRKKD